MFNIHFCSQAVSSTKIMTHSLPTIYHFYNRLFFADLWAPTLAIPGFRTVAEDKDLLSADCVVINVPSVVSTNRVEQLFNLRKLAPCKQIWIADSLECEVNYRELAESGFMELFDIEMTYRQSSDVWRPYIPRHLGNTYKDILVNAGRRQCCAFVSSGVNKSDRRAYMTELMRNLKVHSYGKFKRNRWLLRDRGVETKLKVLPKYNYTLAFENSIAPDYVTEKFYQPLMTGSVPVYLGAPNIEEFAPGDNCFVNAANFDGPADLAAFIRQADPADFQVWRKQKLRQEFLQKLDRVKTPWPQMLSKMLIEKLSEKAIFSGNRNRQSKAS